MTPLDETATEGLTTEHFLARLIFVTCEVAKSTQRIEAQMDQITDRLDYERFRDGYGDAG
jgi:hypothetical protein